MPRKLTREQRLEKYRAAAEDFYIDSYGNIRYINETMLKTIKSCPENCIERLGACMWIAAISEIQAIFGDLMDEQQTLLYKRQRGYYSSMRFCMETIADLEYLFLHPKELSRFMTNGDEIKDKMETLKKVCKNEKEFDEKFNQLMIEGKINSRITDRIAQTLPGCLRDYSMLCLYSHPSMEGFRLYSDKDGTNDLMFQKITYLTFKVLASYYRILLQLKLLDSETDVSFDSIVFLSLDCHRRVVNAQTQYSRKEFRQKQIRHTAKLVKSWAHESKVGE